MTLRLKNVKKHFLNSSFVLGPVDLSISNGTATAIIGRNGSGKSTFFQLLTGNYDADEGEIYFEDQQMSREAYSLKRKIGYLPQHLELPKWVTPLELLNYAVRLYDLEDSEKRVQDATMFWDIASFQKTPMASCSYGMKKRVGLALASIHNPSVLILDEPFSGLDLFHIKALENTIEKRSTMAQLTLISTHVPFYAAKHCNQMYTVNRGIIEQAGEWPELNIEARIHYLDQLFFKT